MVSSFTYERVKDNTRLIIVNEVKALAGLCYGKSSRNKSSIPAP